MFIDRINTHEVEGPTRSSSGDGKFFEAVRREMVRANPQIPQISQNDNGHRKAQEAPNESQEQKSSLQ